jgi:hypothetical protein
MMVNIIYAEIINGKLFIKIIIVINHRHLSKITCFKYESVSEINGEKGLLKNPLFRGCSKMLRCEARKKPNSEAYLEIR